jgi:hypothetical protein
MANSATGTVMKSQGSQARLAPPFRLRPDTEVFKSVKPKTQVPIEAKVL